MALACASHVAVQFFSEDRVGALLNKHLQEVLESVLFEPRAYRRALAFEGEIVEVPVRPDARDTVLGTAHGVLMHEVLHAPDSVLKPLLAICIAAADLCIGDFKSSFVQLLQFVTRVAVRA